MKLIKKLSTTEVDLKNTLLMKKKNAYCPVPLVIPAWLKYKQSLTEFFTFSPLPMLRIDNASFFTHCPLLTNISFVDKCPFFVIIVSQFFNI